MPYLDVSDILLDPEFLDTSGTYTRNTQTVASNGRALDTPVTLPLFAVFTNLDGSILMRQSDGSHIVDTITVHTQTRLTAGQSGLDADIVTWAGADYTVTNVANYSTYGAGFIAATCTIVQLSGGAA